MGSPLRGDVLWLVKDEDATSDGPGSIWTRQTLWDGALMHVGALRVELRIRGVRSLKEKRRVVKSIIADIGQRHPVAIAEVDHQSLWQRADLGIAVVSGSPGHVDEMLDAIERDLDGRSGAEVMSVHRSYLEESER